MLPLAFELCVLSIGRPLFRISYKGTVNGYESAESEGSEKWVFFLTSGDDEIESDKVVTRSE